MQFERMGVVVFFGILVPGAYLTAFLVLTAACLLEFNGIQGHTEVLAFISKNAVFIASIFVFIAYLVGVILRLFAPKFIDNVSTFYLVHIRHQKGEWIPDLFPYEKSLTEFLNSSGMHKIARLITNLNKQYGVPHNTLFFSYCKLFIESNNDTLGEHIRQDEALVRFLSGTSLALMLSGTLGVIQACIFLIKGQWLYFQAYSALTLLSMMILAAILERFKNQRRREVSTVWYSMYLLLNGGVSNKLGITPDELQRRISLEMQDMTEHAQEGR